MGQAPTVTLCYEAGYDGFWLARLLEQRGIDCLVMEPASLQVNRRARRVKTDRIDVEALLHTLIAWRRGERHVCSMVVIPSVEEEDLRRSHRERDRLVRERTAHINRIKGLPHRQSSAPGALSEQIGLSRGVAFRSLRGCKIPSVISTVRLR